MLESGTWCEGTWFSTAGSEVKTICPENFPKGSSETWFVAFYAPWCSFCKDFKQYWVSLAKPAAKTPGKVGAVDCSLNADLCEKMGVNAYPWTKALHNGVWSDGPYDLSLLKLQAWTQKVVSDSPVKLEEAGKDVAAAANSNMADYYYVNGYYKPSPKRCLLADAVVQLQVVYTQN